MVTTVASAVNEPRFTGAVRDGILFRKAAARMTWPAGSIMPSLRKTPREGHVGPSGPQQSRSKDTPAWCEATAGGDAPSTKCGCSYPGIHGELCEERHEAFCLNQCSGNGRCAELGGFCNCDSGYFGVDCSLTVERGQVVLHANHPARRQERVGRSGLREEHAQGGGTAQHESDGGSRSPRIYVYELPDHTSLVLQYRAAEHMYVHEQLERCCVHSRLLLSCRAELTIPAYFRCTPRKFSSSNKTVWNSGYAYSIDVALHEALLRHTNRVASPEDADFFYIPTYLS